MDCTVELLLKPFQSTLLQEERRVTVNELYQRGDISIHAPTRGATSCYCVRINCLLFQSTLLQEERHSNSAMFAIWYIFQSTLLQEERPWSGRVHQSHFLFQSTLLQEERQFRCNSLASVLNFNPRSYKRSDDDIRDYLDM